MDFADRIAALALRISKQRDSVETEEATKNAFIMPFLSALGYDVFDPHIVIPEYTADVGVKKGEKVDYAIQLAGHIVMLVECKPCKTKLSTDHMSQLYRYFSVTESRFSILTNGIIYWFFTDLEQANKMDSKPFFEFDMLNYRPAQIDELKKFSINNFDVNVILETANDLKYGSLLMKEIASEIESTSDEVTRILIGRVYDGKITANVMGKFGPLVQKAMKDTIREMINQRLSSAIDDSSQIPLLSSEPAKSGPVDMGSLTHVSDVEEVVTTQEEIDGYNIVRAISREIVKVDRVVMRDAKSYCAILLDNNNRKPICRLHFNRETKYVGFIDADKNEEKVKITSLEDIFSHSAKIKHTILGYEGSKPEN